jgi:hypothetical protein
MAEINFRNTSDDHEVQLFTELFHEIGTTLQQRGIDFKVQQCGDGSELETKFVIDFDGWESRSLDPDYALCG